MLTMGEVYDERETHNSIIINGNIYNIAFERGEKHIE